jgi:hypothetical protein
LLYTTPIKKNNTVIGHPLIQKAMNVGIGFKVHTKEYLFALYSYTVKNSDYIVSPDLIAALLTVLELTVRTVRGDKVILDRDPMVLPSQTHLSDYYRVT